MGTLLSIYTHQRYKEHMLSAVKDQDESIVIDADVFGLKDNYVIKLENRAGKWYFIDEKEEIEVGDNLYNGEEIRDSVHYIIKSKSSTDIIAVTAIVKDSLFEVYNKYLLEGIEEITIGNNDANDIQIQNLTGKTNIVSDNHAIIRKNNNSWIIDSVGANGSFVNGSRIEGKMMLCFGDTISIWGLKIIYLEKYIAINRGKSIKIKQGSLKRMSPEILYNNKENEIEDIEGENEDKHFFHRSPRNIEKIYSDPVEIEMPPSPKENNDTPLFMLIGPSFTMMLPMLLGSSMAMLNSSTSGGSYMSTGIITAASSGVLGVFWAVTNLRFQKKKAKEDETKRIDAYSNYIMKCADNIKEKYASNQRILNERYPEPMSLLGWKEIPERLWQRNAKHEDFLYHRIGIGNIPFQVNIIIPKEHFTIGFDTLADNPQFIKDQYSVLENVPVCIDMKNESLVGVIGGDKKEGAYTVIETLIAQIAVSNAYTEVKIALISGMGENRERHSWEFVSWLPHTWSADRKFRFLAIEKNEVSEVCYELLQIMRDRSEKNDVAEKKACSPHFVVIVEDSSILEGEPILKYILDTENIGFTTFIMAERFGDLPNQCNRVIQNDDEYTGLIDLNQGISEGLSVKIDAVNPDVLLNTCRALSGIKLNESEIGGEIPTSLTFFDMYGARSIEDFNVKERWRKNRTYESMRALIGVKTGGQPCFLDLHEKYHGPHGLVAGTTGSGKSETLQTYLLSLAINFSPDDVGLFIIDFKGGGMGNLFTDLPHVLGQISNLSGNQVRRAMVSIKSENTRRQRIFNQNGVNNINAYTRLYKNGETQIPIPHLFIVIDEFAELKREEPEFMQELISVAQVGRSLGVHLILATQKPSGTVDDNIWSNTKFRLCLRVQDRQDSMDMLHKADAAYLTQAGRGYLQVGNDEIYELFQSGWSGAEYDEDFSGYNQETAKMVTNTGRTAIVGNHLKTLKMTNARNRWYEKITEAVKTVFDDETDADNIVAAVFEKLNAGGLDFKYSDYNAGLIKNFCVLYLEKCVEVRDTISLSKTIREEALKKGMKLPEVKEKTQLDAIVEYIAKVYREGGYKKHQPLWLPVLPEKIYLESIMEIQEIFNGWKDWTEKHEISVPIGLCDDPENQYQMPLLLNFAQDGNHAICGIGMSGKSIFLQTAVYALINKYSPEYLNIYMLDFSNRMLEPFENAPHVGGILYESDVDTVGKFFNMLKGMIKERKELFRGGNYYQYIMKNGLKCPVVLVVIDNISNFRDKTEEKYDNDLVQISKECSSNGIYLLISAVGFGVSEISGKLSENIKRAISLEMSDKYGYSDIIKTTNIAIVPDSGIHGRGLVKIEERALEFQTCLACKGENDYERAEKIKERCIKMFESWEGSKARKIPRVPEKPIWSDFSELYEVKKMMNDGDALPFGYDYKTADIVGMSLKDTSCYLVIGKRRGGKTNLLKIITRAGIQMNADISIVEFGNEEMLAEAGKTGARYISDIKKFIGFMAEVIRPQMVERAGKKKKYLAEGMEDDEIFEKMRQYRKIFVIIPDFISFIKEIKDTTDTEDDLNGLMANYFEKGSGTNIFFVTEFDYDRKSEIQGNAVYESFVKHKTGIHLGGNADIQNILDFSQIKYSELKNIEKPGTGYISSDDKAIKVTVPFVGK